MKSFLGVSDAFTILAVLANSSFPKKISKLTELKKSSMSQKKSQGIILIWQTKRNHLCPDPSICKILPEADTPLSSENTVNAAWAQDAATLGPTEEARNATYKHFQQVSCVRRQVKSGKTFISFIKCAFITQERMLSLGSLSSFISYSFVYISRVVGIRYPFLCTTLSGM